MRNLNIIVGKDAVKEDFIVLSILILLLWIKTIITFKGTKKFGPIIVIFLLSTKGIIYYILSFIILNMVGSSFGYLFFYRIGTNFVKNWLNSFLY